jgi:hypothetical protein
MLRSLTASCLAMSALLVGCRAAHEPPQPKMTDVDSARHAMAVRALRELEGEAICLGIDASRTKTPLGTNPESVMKDVSRRDGVDPDPGLFARLAAPRVVPLSQCPEPSYSDRWHHVVVGPAHVGGDGRVEMAVWFGSGGFPTVERCVGEYVEAQWKLTCEIVFQA